MRAAVKFVAIFGVIVYTAGCAITPNTVSVEIDHYSHATQHEPFTRNPTRYGCNVANVVAHWNTPHHTFVELGEGLNLNRHYESSDSYGEIMGPREQFTLRIGKTFVIR